MNATLQAERSMEDQRSVRAAVRISDAQASSRAYLHRVLIIAVVSSLAEHGERVGICQGCARLCGPQALRGLDADPSHDALSEPHKRVLAYL